MAIYINGKKVAGAGLPGAAGKSAYQSAVEGGYTGTESEFDSLMANVGTKPKFASVTLSSSGWASNSQAVTVTGVLADEAKQLIQPMPAVASQQAYMTAGIYCSGQAANSLTFTCSKVPTEDITIYVVITEVGA